MASVSVSIVKGARRQFCLLMISIVFIENSSAQNVGIGTTNPQSTLDVRGNQRIGGINNFIKYDSVSGKIEWTNSHLFLPNNQQLIQHSNSAEGLFYNNSALEYRNQFGVRMFSTNWSNGIGYFGGNVGIGQANPIAPLSFSSEIGEKINFWGDASPHYGIGIQSYLMQLHTDGSGSDIAFGYGSTDEFTETMRVKGNGNVGIGTTSPGAKLEVNGSIKADSFKFTNPRTYYYSMDATGFTIEEGNFEVRKLYNHGAYIVGSTNTLVAPLSLPHNAVIKSLTAYVYDISSTINLNVIIARRDNSIFRLQMGGIASSGNSGLVSYSFNFPDNPANLIDNLQYSYLLNVFVNGANSWPTNGDLQIKRVIVAYTLPEVQ